MKKISRRDFLKGISALGTLSALYFLTGCSKQGSSTVNGTTTTTAPIIVEPLDPYEQNRLIIPKEDYFTGEFIVYDNGFIDPKSINAIVVEDEATLNSIDVLINKYYEIKQGWVPNDLEYINTNFERTSQLRHEAALAWSELDIAAKEAGLTLYARDGWRSEWLQNTYFTNAYNNSPARASCYNALPWRSEHQLGIALDVSDVTTTENSLRQDFEFTEHGQFLRNEGWKYGWIVRYTTDTQEITQYFNEPWHIRYVGKELAKLLVENNLTLEEYHNANYQ